MTEEEAKEKQADLAKHFDLGFWYGINCEKCCGVFPKFMTGGNQGMDCWYECEVCGKRTKPTTMPWIAEKAWNAGETIGGNIQMSLF